MKRKAKKHAGLTRKEHVLSEAELKKLAAGFQTGYQFLRGPGRWSQADCNFDEFGGKAWPG